VGSRSIFVLTEPEIRTVAGIDSSSLAAVEQAFAALNRGEALMPAPIDYDLPSRRGEVHIKSAYLHGLNTYAVKVASGFYENPKLGLPSSSGLMLVMSTETGLPEAMLLDNGYLTDLRTALAGAIAARHFARTKIEAVGIIGTGVQARMQLEALRLVRSFERVFVYGRTPDAVQKYVTEMSLKLELQVIATPTAREVARHADLVVTTTPARSPLLMGDDLRPGVHVTAIGADLAGKQELHPSVFAVADRVACDREPQCMRVGELQHAARAGVLPPIVELGDVVLGNKPGRQKDDEITICDLTGVGIQDTAIADFVYQQALARGLGHNLAA